MSDPYNELLEATIQHIQNLKARGVKYVSIAPETLSQLEAMPRRQITVPPPAPVTQQRGPVLAEVTAKPAVQAPVLEKPRTPPAAQIVSGIKSSTLQSKAGAIEELRQRAQNCVKCAHLASSRKNVVFGVGNIESELMFVGEAPGADEDVQGEPFVGRAGQLLTKIIEAMGLRRSSVYIANILKCRPDTPGETSGNRKPTPQEMQTCIPFLHEQIDIIQPKVLVALGGTAIEGLLGKTTGITRLRGVWQTYRGIPLMPTFHPSFLLRDQNISQKRLVWEDMMQVMEKLGMTISEKQRRFFTKA